MSAKWDIALNPTTFQPVATVVVNGRRLPFEISIEQIHDNKFNENEFMLLLLNNKETLSDDDIIELFSALKQKFLKPTK